MVTYCSNWGIASELVVGERDLAGRPSADRQRHSRRRRAAQQRGVDAVEVVRWHDDGRDPVDQQALVGQRRRGRRRRRQVGTERCIGDLLPLQQIAPQPTAHEREHPRPDRAAEELSPAPGGHLGGRLRRRRGGKETEGEPTRGRGDGRGQQGEDGPEQAGPDARTPQSVKTTGTRKLPSRIRVGSSVLFLVVYVTIAVSVQSASPPPRQRRHSPVRISGSTAGAAGAGNAGPGRAGRLILSVYAADCSASNPTWGPLPCATTIALPGVTAAMHSAATHRHIASIRSAALGIFRSFPRVLTSAVSGLASAVVRVRT